MLFRSFIEKDCKKRHWYAENNDEMAGAWDFPHKLITLDGYRYAVVKKTVAYIAVDEDEYGLPVMVKWRIYSHRIFDNA